MMAVNATVLTSSVNTLLKSFWWFGQNFKYILQILVVLSVLTGDFWRMCSLACECAVSHSDLLFAHFHLGI